MKYAILENNIVVNIIKASPEFISEQGLVGVAITNELVNLGDTYANGVFTAPAVDVNAVVDAAIARAVVKGQEIFNRLRRENVLLGIESATIEGRAATDVVLERGAMIMSALNSGSTKAAIRYCKAFDPLQMDGTFLSSARLLGIANELEAFHGLPISASL